MKQKLVLAWVDQTGFELTGRYRDRLGHYPETRTTPEAKAACWGENTPELLDRLQKHIEQERKGHDWMGYFVLDYNSDILANARKLALEAAVA